MKTTKFIIAGFGGQGVLFTGKFIAYCGMVQNANVSWLPSYGPEMRGGTANCSVILSDDSIGSPMVDEPDCLIALNQPSYDKFINSVAPNGKVFIDSTLVTASKERTDIQIFEIPANALSTEHNLKGLSNMIVFGKLLAETALFSDEDVEAALVKTVTDRKKDLLEANRRALALGRE